MGVPAGANPFPGGKEFFNIFRKRMFCHVKGVQIDHFIGFK
jgi:hypothetical protein